MLELIHVMHFPKKKQYPQTPKKRALPETKLSENPFQKPNKFSLHYLKVVTKLL